MELFLLLNYSVGKSSCHTENKIWTESKDCGVSAVVCWGGAGTFKTINHIFKEMASETSLFQVVTDNFHQVQLFDFYYKFSCQEAKTSQPYFCEIAMVIRDAWCTLLWYVHTLVKIDNRKVVTQKPFCQNVCLLFGPFCNPWCQSPQVTGGDLMTSHH